MAPTGIGYHLVPRIRRPKIYGFGRWKYARVPVLEGHFNDTKPWYERGRGSAR